MCGLLIILNNVSPASGVSARPELEEQPPAYVLVAVSQTRDTLSILYVHVN